MPSAPCCWYLRQAGSRARVAQRRDAVAQPQPERVGDRIIARTVGTRHVRVQIHQRRQDVFAARVDDQVTARAVCTVARERYGVERNDVDDPAVLDDDVDRTFRRRGAAVAGRAAAGHHDAAANDEAIRLQALRRAERDRQAIAPRTASAVSNTAANSNSVGKTTNWRTFIAVSGLGE